MKQEVLEVIKSRRSIRSYEEKQISEEELDAVLEAGTYAPTGMGAQSPVIVAVQDQEVIAQLVEMNAGIMGTSSNPYYGAPTIVLVFADTARGTWLQDGSCVLENMMIAAHSIGLGSCWINREMEMFASAEGKALMKAWGLEDHLSGVGAIALGYPKGEVKKAVERKGDYIKKII